MSQSRDRSGPLDQLELGEPMSIGDHLDELRRRLVLALAGVALACVGTLIYADELIAWLNQPLFHVHRMAGLPPQAYMRGVSDYFLIYMKVGIIAGIIIAGPWVLYQLWKFIESGLYRSERKAVLLMTPLSAVLTIAGVLFTYHILLPVSVAFLIFFAMGAPRAGDYQPGLIDRLSEQYGTVQQPVQPSDEDAPAQPSPEVDDVAVGNNIVKPGMGTPAAQNQALTPVVVPRLREDPVEPVEGQIWIKAPEGDLRIHLGGSIRMITLTAPSGVTPLIGITEYISFAAFLMLATTLAFQMPLFLMILGWTGIIDPARLGPYRRYAIFACFFGGAILTPADPISMFLMAIPLWLLFEFGMLLMKWSYRDRSPVMASLGKVFDGPDAEGD